MMTLTATRRHTDAMSHAIVRIGCFGVARADGGDSQDCGGEQRSLRWRQESAV
jgi:hypothetical protein